MKEKKLHLNRSVRFKRFSRKAYSVFNSLHKIVSIGVLAACTLTFANTGKAVAQSDSTRQTPQGTFSEQELEEVTVTASRIETPVNQAAKIVTVITAREIAAAPVQSVEELLNYIANIDVVQRGGHGVQSDISIRGGSADQTAVLLNGINLSNSHTGHYSFDFPINLSDIERIEILHGPSALVYGSSAFSGGINIITRKKSDYNLLASLEGGMHAFRSAEIRGALDTKSTNNSLSIGYKASDGYIANSDYNIYNLLWQSRLHFQSNSHLDFLAGYNQKKYGANTFYSVTYPNQYERTSEIVGAVSGVFGNRFKFVPQLYWTRHFDQFDLIKDTETGRNFHRGDTYGANMMFQITSLLGATYFGGELRREEIMSSNLGQPLAHPEGHYKMYDDRTQTNIALEHTFLYRKFIFSAGVLANYNTLQNDGFRFYPSVSVAYSPVNQLKIYTTWNRSSRLPTFTDLYYTTETHNANGQLQAERSESFDLGLTYRNAFMEATFTGYMMNGRNMIDWVREAGETKWASWNFTEVNKRGVESSLKFPLYNVWRILGKNSLFSISYARMDQDADSKGLESRYTLNYLRDKLTVQFKHDIINHLTVNWNFRYQDRMGEFRMYEDGKDLGMKAFPPFSTLDVKLMYEQQKFSVYLDLNNLYNTYYYDIGNVPQAGFWLIGGVRYEY
ncbi:MAG: TonB-dependent receptor [Tannerella sp.]|jgi:iron complex outermembrane receptor protein|nr:TonB-dependent receptor [Tannerella sp.]